MAHSPDTAPRFHLEPSWSVTVSGERRTIEPLLFALLEAVRAGGNLKHAAAACQVSYRHAWGLLRSWEDFLGERLVATRQGRGATLTAYGATLLDAPGETTTALDEALEETAVALTGKLDEVRDRRASRVLMASSHGDSVLALKHQLADSFTVALEVAGSQLALERFRAGEADIAGFHLPLGSLGPAVGRALFGLLHARGDVVFLLEERVLGLCSRRDAPIASVDALVAGGHRLINRQPGAGTRLVLDELLRRGGHEPSRIPGYDDEEYSHSAVAAMVASGAADAGIASSGAAERMKLAFEPLLTERFYIVLSDGASARLRRSVNEICKRLPLPPEIPAAERHPTVEALRELHGHGGATT